MELWLRFVQSLSSQPAFSRALAETGWINILLSQLQTDKLSQIDPVMHVSHHINNTHDILYDFHLNVAYSPN